MSEEHPSASPRFLTPSRVQTERRRMKGGGERGGEKGGGKNENNE